MEIKRMPENNLARNRKKLGKIESLERMNQIILRRLQT